MMAERKKRHAELHPDGCSDWCDDCEARLTCTNGRHEWPRNYSDGDTCFCGALTLSANSVDERPHTQSVRLQSAAGLNHRKGLVTKAPGKLGRQLGIIAKDHRLLGCVLISFTRDRVCTNTSGEGEMLSHMQRLADQLLAAIDDGQFDPTEAQR